MRILRCAATVMCMMFVAGFAVSKDAPVALQSGTPVGKRPGPYSFLVATGPQRGQSER